MATLPGLEGREFDMTVKQPKRRPRGHREDATRIDSLSADLASRDAVVRIKARETLLAMGTQSVPSLIRLLSHAKPHVRWEAAKVLSGIADPIAASALVNALDDPDSDVRWLAAEGLVALGRDGLEPLLAALLEQTGSCSLFEGALRVCRRLARKEGLGPILQGLLAALRRPEQETAVPAAAYAALSKLREEGSSR